MITIDTDDEIYIMYNGFNDGITSYNSGYIIELTSCLTIYPSITCDV